MGTQLAILAAYTVAIAIVVQWLCVRHYRSKRSSLEAGIIALAAKTRSLQAQHTVLDSQIQAYAKREVDVAWALYAAKVAAWTWDSVTRKYEVDLLRHVPVPERSNVALSRNPAEFFNTVHEEDRPKLLALRQLED